MNRLEFIIAIAVVLFIAFVLGWWARRFVSTFARASGADLTEMEALAKALYEAEEMRDHAIAHLHQREADLTNQLNQTEAELRAAMDGLRDARHEAGELRAYIEHVNQDTRQNQNRQRVRRGGM